MSALLTIDQLAHRLSKHPRTLRNWVDLGYITAYRYAGRRGLFFDPSEVERELRALPPGTVRDSYGGFGPKARIRTLTPRPVVVEPRVTDGTDGAEA